MTFLIDETEPDVGTTVLLPQVGASSLTAQPITGPSHGKVGQADTSHSATTSGVEVQSTIQDYTGEIMDIDGEDVLLSLHDGADYWEGEFPKSSFSAGGAIAVGNAVRCRYVRLSNGAERWLNEVHVPPPASAEEVREIRERLAERFEGSGL